MNVRRLALGTTLLLTTIGVAAICSPTTEWEVVSVKPCTAEMATPVPTGSRGSSRVGPDPRRLDLPCTSAMTLIVMGYFTFADGQVNATIPLPVEGGPGWINSESYKITAVAEGSPGPAMMRGPMLQAILEDRFKLKVHRETREMPTFTLTVAKGGLKVHPIDDDCWRPDRSDENYAFAGTGVYVQARLSAEARRACDGWREQPAVGPNRALDFYASSLNYFSRRLRAIVGRPVINQTGVDGLFDLHIEFAPDGTTPRYYNVQSPLPPGTAMAEDPAGPSFFAALEQQLGLKLSSSRGPGEVFIIDHIQRPTPN